MFAIVKDGRVTQLVREGTAFTVDSVTYHGTWPNHATAAMKSAIGFYTVTETAHPDRRFYWDAQPVTAYNSETDTVTVTYPLNPKILEDRPEVDAEGNPILDSEGEQVVARGIKTWYPLQLTDQHDSQYALTQWQDIRESQDGTAVDPAVVAYREALATELGRLHGIVAAATDVATVAAIQPQWPDTRELQDQLRALPPQPYPSWTLDTEATPLVWLPPVPYPTDGGIYTWSEDTGEWTPRPE